MNTPTRYRTDPATQCLAIMCGGELYTHAGGAHIYPHIPEPRGDLRLGTRLAGLALWAIEQGIHALWIVPEYSDTESARRWHQEARQDELERECPALAIQTITTKGRKIGAITVRRRGGDGAATGIRATIYHAGIWEGGLLTAQLDGFLGCNYERAENVAAALMLAQQALGHRISTSLSRTGLELMRDQIAAGRWESRGVDLAPMGRELRALVREHEPRELLWCRPLREDEGECGCGPPHPRGVFPATPHCSSVYVWKYDAYSSYLSSANEVPTGEPLPTAGYVPNCPGLYRISATCPGADGVPAPTAPLQTYWCDPSIEQHDFGTVVASAWAWEPQIRLALALGWTIEIHEGWYWPKRQVHPILRTWQERLWGARKVLAARAEFFEGVPASLATVHGPAATIVKRAGLYAIGRLAPEMGVGVLSVEEAEEGDLGILDYDMDLATGAYTGLATVALEPGRADMVHPEWRAWIMALSIARMQRHVYGLAGDHGALSDCLLGLYVDAMYTTRPIPGLAQPMSAGRFHCDGVAAIPRATLMEPMRPDQFATLWRKCRREQQEAP